MDVDIIRGRFIQEGLQQALVVQDREQAARTLGAFRLYFQWFEGRFSEREKVAILTQLASLEQAYAAESPTENRSRSTYPDRIRHHLQETISLGQ